MRVGAAPTKPGCVSTARWRGPGERGSRGVREVASLSRYVPLVRSSFAFPSDVEADRVGAAQHLADLHVVVQEWHELFPCVAPEPRSRGTSTATPPESVRFDDLFNHVCDPATLLMAFVIDRWYAALTPIWRAT